MISAYSEEQAGAMRPVPGSRTGEASIRPSKLAMMSLGHLAYDGFGLLLSTLLPAIAADLGLSIFQLGVISGAFLVFSALGLLLMGSYSDRVRNKNYLLGGGLVVLSLGIFLAGSADSFLSLLALASIVGFSDGVYHPVGLSVLAGLTTAENRGKVLGVHGACGTIGMMAFPLAAGVIAQGYSWRVAFRALAIFGFLVGGLFLATAGREKPAAVPVRARGRQCIFSFRILYVLAICALCSMAMSGMSTFLPVKLNLMGLPPATIGLYLSIFYGIGILTQSVTGLIVDRLGLKLVIAAYLALVSLSVGLIAVVPAPAVVYILVVAGFFSASFYLLNSLQFIEAVPHETSGTSMGIYYFSGGIASAVSPVLIGCLVQQSNVDASFLLVPAFYLAALGLILWKQ